MLRELERIVDEHERDGITELELQQVAALIRQKQFLWKDRHGQSHSYDLAVKFKAYFHNLFDAFGDDFFVDHHFGYCGIVPSSSKPSLKLLETLFLLILAKLHHEESLKGATEMGRSEPNEFILIDEFVSLTGREKPRRVEVNAALDRLVKVGVIELGSMNEESELRKITILPSIQKVVGDQFIAQLDAFSKTPLVADDEGSDVADESNSDESPDTKGEESE